jgi:AcrR family transcriptional regulator
MVNTTPPRRALRADARRNRALVVNAAKAAFSERGLSVPLEEISARAGVGIGTLYRRFASRHELIEAVMDDMSAEFKQALDRACSNPDPWAGLCSYLEEGVDLVVRNQAIREALGVDAPRSGLALRRYIHPRLEALVQRAKAAGMLRPDVADTDISAVVWACGGVAQTSASLDPEFWRRHLSLVIDGLRAPGTASIPGTPLTEAQVESLIGVNVSTAKTVGGTDD